VFYHFANLIDDVADGHIPGRLEINRAAVHGDHMDIHLSGSRCCLFYSGYVPGSGTGAGTPEARYDTCH
jgi:hypothetical protein